MPTAKKSILTVTELDFDEIKTNLIAYLDAQDEFTDYDFEGSGLNILIDLLAYNTHYLAFYINMLANESFLDSAIIRSSVVSLAKHIGYTPRSYRAATAVVDITGAAGVTELTRGSRFSTTIGGTSYSFFPDQTYTVSGGAVSDVTLKEGEFLTYTFIVDTVNTEQRFIIPNANIDTSTLTVEVQESLFDVSTRTTYTLADDINTLTSTDTVYYLQETIEGDYEVTFGDGVLGKALTNGNVIILEYVATNGSLANGVSSFTFGGATVTVTSNAAGGAEPQGIESIKFTAPRNYQAQNRAVTARDYETVVKANYGNIESVSVYGGEENNPPDYGKVFIALKPKQNYVISQATKDAISEDILKSRNVVSVIPEFADPDFTYLVIDSVVRYDTNLSTVTREAMQVLVEDGIELFASSNLNKFNAEFRYSQLISNIDDTDTSITGNLTTVKLQKRFTPTVNVAQGVTLDFGNAIFHPHDGHGPATSSNSFQYEDTNGASVTAFLDDDGVAVNNVGKMRVYKLVDAVKVYLSNDIGSIDYVTGKVTLNNFKPLTGTGEISVTVEIEKNDVVPKTNTILTVDSATISVTVEKESDPGVGVAVNAGSSTSSNSGGTTSGSGG
jgi:hypothetical protein